MHVYAIVMIVQPYDWVEIGPIPCSLNNLLADNVDW